MSVSDDEFIPTKGSIAKGNHPKDFKTVIFKSYKSKTASTVKERDEQPDQSVKNELNIRKVKHEIIKFGMSGFDTSKKEEVKMQLAIKLGAKPPKNKYKNYKLLLQEKAKQRDLNEQRSALQQVGKNSVGKSTSKGKSYDRKKKKKLAGGLLDVYGKPNLTEIKTK